MVSLLAAALLLPPSCCSLTMQRPRLAEIEHPGRGEGGVAGRACARRTDAGNQSRGCELPAHLPRALLGLDSVFRTQLRRQLEKGNPWGWRCNGGSGIGEKEDCAFGAGGLRRAVGAKGRCIVGRAQREDSCGGGW